MLTDWLIVYKYNEYIISAHESLICKLFHHSHLRAHKSSLQNALSAFTAINNRTRPTANIYRELWFVEDHWGTTEWGRRRWKGGVVEKSFLPAGKTVFFLYSARFISPNRFSTDSPETMHIFAFTLPRWYINTTAAFYFSSRLIHAAGLSQRKFHSEFTTIFYSEDWKVTDTDSV